MPDISVLDRLRCAEDYVTVWKAASLASHVFMYDRDPRTPSEGLAELLYACQLALQSVILYQLHSFDHITVLARPPNADSERASVACSNRPEIASPHSGQLAAFLNLTLKSANTELAVAFGVPVGSTYGLITNVVVARRHRRRGIANFLLLACDHIVTRLKGRTPTALALYVYADNLVALRLYESRGFKITAWTDPIWLEEAEKSKVGKARRLLLAKRLLTV